MVMLCCHQCGGAVRMETAKMQDHNACEIYGRCTHPTCLHPFSASIRPHQETLPTTAEVLAEEAELVRAFLSLSADQQATLMTQMRPDIMA